MQKTPGRFVPARYLFVRADSKRVGVLCSAIPRPPGKGVIVRLRHISAVCTAALIAVFACDDGPGAEMLQGVDGSLAAAGPPPVECDVKNLPARDYFSSREDVKQASSLLRDLSDACLSGTAIAYDIGFQLLGMIEAARRIPPPEEAETVFSAGGVLVEGIWTAMEFTGPACSDCDVGSPTAAQARRSLEPGGAFGVRSSGRNAVYSMGDSEAVRWGVEPNGVDWDAVLPGGRALIYGYPGDQLGVLRDAILPGTDYGFNWSVVPWYVDPWADDGSFLLVGSCAESTGQNVPLVSHVASLLPPGPSPSYCSADDPLIASSIGTQVVRLASLVLPFWPQALQAAAEGPGSGKAREFSPFWGWEVAGYAATMISEPLEEATPVGESICFEPADCGPFTFDWTTQGGSDLATRETFRIFSKDNNGATVDFVDGWQAVGGAECVDTGRNEIECECDGREGIGACDGIVLEDLALNKPGAYSICVESVGDQFGSGLNIAACTEKFQISP